MSADLNVNQIEEKISVLDQPEESARVDCNGNGKVNDHHGPDPVCAEDSVADQVGELKADRVESESNTGFRDEDDPIEKEEDLQDAEKVREEKLADIPEDHDVEGDKKGLINHAELSNAVAEAQESHDTSVHVAESELNQSNNDEERVEEESKLNSTIDIKEHEDSQAVAINGVHNDLDLDRQRDLEEAQELQDTSVHVAESGLNRSNNDEEMVEEESKLNSTIEIKEHEDSQAVAINGVHNDLDLDQQRDLAELIATEYVSESEPSQSRNDDEKVEESQLVSEDSQAVVSNAAHNILASDHEKKLKELMNNDDVTEFKPKQSSNDVEKVKEESKLDLAIHVEEIEDSQAAVINGVCNSLDLNQEKELPELIKDLPLEDSVEESVDPFKQNLETVPCPVMADDKLEAESAEGPTSDENRDGLPVGHAQDTAAETQVVDDLVDAKQNISKSSSENVELVATSDAETGQRFPISSDNGTAGDETSHILMDAVQSEVPDANGLDIHEKGGLLTSQESASQTVLVNDFVHTPEQNHTLEISTEVSSPAVLEEAPVESSESFPVSPINDIGAEPIVRIEDSCPVEDSKLCDIVRTETKVDNIGESADSHPVDVSKVEAEVENVLVAPSGHANDVNLDIGASSHSIESDERVSNLSIGNVDVESEVTEAVNEGDSNRTSVSFDNPDGETFKCDSTGNESYMPKNEVQADSEVENISTAAREEVPNRDGVVSQLEGEVGKNETPKPTLEDSAVVTSDEQYVVAELGKGPFYIIKVPRFDERNLREKVEDAKFQVEEKSKIRDAIQAQIQIIKAKRKEYEESFLDARSEEKAARDLLKAKRKEIDSVQYIINRTRNVLEIEEIDGRIRSMEHKIQHETLPLKEEKQFIRDIKQLKQIREQLSSNMGSQDEVQQAMDQKDQSEERLKSLRKEADALRDSLLKAEAVTEDAKKKYNDEHEKINQLLFQHRAANDIRQEAFAHLQSLRRQLYEKSKFFYKYKDDFTTATNLALKGDKEELQRHCANQVERVMELWNNNDEFRKEYMSSNMRNTLRRLRTLDGRALGPDEQPPIIPNVVSQRVTKHNVAPSAPPLEVEKPVTPVETQRIDEKSTAKLGDKKNQTVKTKKQANPASLENGLPTVSGRDQIEESRKEENKLTKEEESRQENKLTKEEVELARKIEDLRKEKEAAMLKEQRRLEEKAKAKEAMERKKRNAEKAQARALLRAQREAEQKEKEKEKKAKKKEKKKAAAEDTKDTDEVESVPSSETPTETNESERTEKPLTVAKRPQKQTKAKSMPLPLRNKGKRKMQTWMWALITLLAVIALFFMGNSSFFNLGLQQRFGI
ncbi:PREDICTED: myosin heavy chain, fast skeletal muscle [Populus euphratica]|uniref:Myosin heavy chain, fast skeletal muscle n=1 Tax=Populus euphratica TaxID=75702 RepID=A0AAJ6T4Z3_POPEU|nr:PREDICTED: myosin heavy chain, fast skeletal muscle [Populus euphratica]XP_011004826.1 PREDICTED: myosin heavy chain, fast skeletal muscle [Populus euphratica]XP_011004827.1 PREDICTED: myosin heavy chain, fast skeletal muscle [Populus euphratica]